MLLTTCCLILLVAKTTSQTSHEPVGLGLIGDTSTCDHLSFVDDVNPIRTAVDSVHLSEVDSFIEIVTSSKDAVCAVGVGVGNFPAHGSRSSSTGIPFSWMNKDPSSDIDSLTKMLQVEVFETHFNVIDRTVKNNEFTNPNMGGKCTCPDGTETMVAARQGSTCEQLHCYGGSSSMCTSDNEFSWRNKMFYCSNQTQTDQSPIVVQTTQIFDALDSLTPTRTIEGGTIRISDNVLNGASVHEWVTFVGKSVIPFSNLDRSKWLKNRKVGSSDDPTACHELCDKRDDCVGTQTDVEAGCLCCLFIGPFILKPKSNTMNFNDCVLKWGNKHSFLKRTRCSRQKCTGIHFNALLAMFEKCRHSNYFAAIGHTSLHVICANLVDERPDYCSQAPKVMIKKKKMVQASPTLYHNPLLCSTGNNQVDCACCATKTTAGCLENGVLKILETVQCGSNSYKYRCMVQHSKAVVYDPTYAR